jgi:hypothetical protein
MLAADGGDWNDDGTVGVAAKAERIALQRNNGALVGALEDLK